MENKNLNLLNENDEDNEILQALNIAKNQRQSDNEFLESATDDERIAFLLKSYKESAKEIKKSKLNKFEED